MSRFVLHTSEVIGSFRYKGLEAYFEKDDGRKLPPDMLARISEILTALEAASSTKQLDRPSFRLHPLKGNLKGRWAVAMRANWRIVFRFDKGRFHDVDFLDYH